MKKKRSFIAVCCVCGTKRKTTFNMAAQTTVLRCATCCNLTKHTLVTDMEEEW